MKRALCLAAASGFIALSWEILWARLYTVASQSRATAFGAMLGSYLLGLAFGSLCSIKWQKTTAVDSVRHLSGLLLLANVLAYLVAPLVAVAAHWLPEKMWLWNGWEIQSWLWSLPLVTVASAFQGTVLPLLCHVAIPATTEAGSRLSYVYLANIIGSSLGSLLTGFLLMDHLTLGRLSALLLCAGGALAYTLCAVQWIRWVVALALLLAIYPVGYTGLWERLLYKQAYTAGMRFEKVYESKHGVICVDSQKHVYGNGAYDGYISTTLKPGDWHVRPYFLSAIHPEPKEVLVVGVSAGAWTQILAYHPQVQKIDAVEISDGYLEVIRSFPEVAGILNDPKVTIHIDDGRRWLKRHPERRYDAIFMNTTHHWREFASALLSREYLELTKTHLKPGGIVMWNCTQSKRAMKTGLKVFPHTIMCLNNCVGSMSPITLDKERWQRMLLATQNQGKPLFDPQDPQSMADLQGVLKLLDQEGSNDSFQQWWYMSRKRMEQECVAEEPITDDNLGHEYPY